MQAPVVSQALTWQMASVVEQAAVQQWLPMQKFEPQASPGALVLVPLQFEPAVSLGTQSPLEQ
jgi:hypothetical protein